LTHDKNGNLPIHAALNARRPSLPLRQALIEGCPASLKKCETEGGNLPLHLACTNGITAAIPLLLEKYPDSIQVANLADDTPYACTEEFGLSEAILDQLKYEGDIEYPNG